MQGANRTGRPFTGDYAGDLLYATLKKYGFAQGDYAARADDTLSLVDCAVTNAVRCLPPQNKPIGAEIASCRNFLYREITSTPTLRAILALGRIAHQSVISALKFRQAAHPFGHAARHLLPDHPLLFDSYHCSRYNTNTKRLTREMFEEVFRDIKQYLNG